MELTCKKFYPVTTGKFRICNVSTAGPSGRAVCGRLSAEIVGSNPTGTWMSVYCECCILLSRGHGDGLITRPEESCPLWCVVECDLETS
jgi:hypothetical protein